MGLIGLFVGLGMFCVLLWYCAIYAMPLFVGLSTGWWALNHGAGAGCIVVGVFIGAVTYWLGRIAITSDRLSLRCVAIALFVIPAAYAGFGIAGELTANLLPVWRVVFGILSALLVACVTYTRMSRLAEG